MKLLTSPKSNPKIVKGEQYGWRTIGLHLAPAKLSGHEVCASRSKSCTASCLNLSGHGYTRPVQAARVARTKLWFKNRTSFKGRLLDELGAFERSCNRNGFKPACRMNLTSDVPWERTFPELFKEFPNIQFYDYTKHYKRCLSNYELPSNYHLTFSRSEDNDRECLKVLHSDVCSVAVVFESSNLPYKWKGYRVLDGDDSDLRFLDPSGVVIGLYAKGIGKKDNSGFVVRKPISLSTRIRNLFKGAIV